MGAANLPLTTFPTSPAAVTTGSLSLIPSALPAAITNCCSNWLAGCEEIAAVTGV